MKSFIILTLLFSFNLQVSAQQDVIEVLSDDINNLWNFCTFTENKWAEAYTDDMVYERVCGTKEVVDE